MTISAPPIQKVIETIEELSPENQNLVIEIIRNRLIQQRRTELMQEVAEGRAAYQAGDVRRGSIDDLFAELEE
ncbi:MAG: hypothetical protein GXP37_07280 [Chloroflexi bacterium]|nr:hypothetical protein [Chloroflexota bacterium]